MTLRNRKRFSDEQLRQARKELANERAKNQRDEARAAARAFVLEEQRAKRQLEYSRNIHRAIKRFRIPMAIALTLLILIPGWRTARVNACLNEQMAYAPSTLERVQELVPSVPVEVLQESSTQGGYAISQMYRAAAEAASSAQSRQYWNTVVEVIGFYEWLERRSFQGTALQEFARECERASWFGQPVLPSYVGPKVPVPWPVPVFE
jgi:hypothetical protein